MNTTIRKRFYYILNRGKTMYLISIYFDEETEKKIKGYMNRIAKHTGNFAMIEGCVPPHITIAAFGAHCEEQAKDIFLKAAEQIESGMIQWVSVAAFFPQVIYLSPVLNEYLHKISEITYKEVMQAEGAAFKGHYKPFAWMPHGTLAKHLNEKQMREAFEVMQKEFAPFDSKIVKIGLAHTNPYEDIMVKELK